MIKRAQEERAGAGSAPRRSRSRSHSEERKSGLSFEVLPSENSEDKLIKLFQNQVTNLFLTNIRALYSKEHAKFRCSMAQ